MVEGKGPAETVSLPPHSSSSSFSWSRGVVGRWDGDGARCWCEVSAWAGPPAIHHSAAAPSSSSCTSPSLFPPFSSFSPLLPLPPLSSGPRGV